MLRKIAASLLATLAAPLAGAQVAPDAVAEARPGDLLFKGADTGTGTRVAAGWSLGDKRWGHVGIVVAGASGGLEVIHADTGAPGEVGAVRRVALGDYLADVYALGRYEVNLEDAARGAYLSYAEQAVGLPFDRGFSLQTGDALYCSELIWRALSAGAGADIQPLKSERFGRVYVSVSDLAENPLVHEAAVITAARDEGGDKRTTRAEAR